MKFDMKMPCSDCPFRREGGIRLSQKRVREIAGMMLNWDGGTFPCHKTVGYEREPKSGNGHRIARPDENHCAGALIFAEKNGMATQMMRIAGRLRMYDGEFSDEAKDAVFADKREMLDANKRPR